MERAGRLDHVDYVCSASRVESCSAAAHRNCVAWGWVDVKCGHKLWARSTSSVSAEMTGRQERLLHAWPELIQDGSHSQRSWHLMKMYMRRSSLVTTEQNICLSQLYGIPCIIVCLGELCPPPSVPNVIFVSDTDLKMYHLLIRGHFPLCVLYGNIVRLHWSTEIVLGEKKREMVRLHFVEKCANSVGRDGQTTIFRWPCHLDYFLKVYVHIFHSKTMWLQERWLSSKGSRGVLWSGVNTFKL